jgi:hypothetical protein
MKMTDIPDNPGRPVIRIELSAVEARALYALVAAGPPPKDGTLRSDLIGALLARGLGL